MEDGHFGPLTNKNIANKLYKKALNSLDKAQKINSNINSAKVSLLTQSFLSHLVTKGIERDEAYRFLQSQSFEIDNLDSYIKNISTNFEEVEEKELQEIRKSFLSEKTNKNFEEKINSVV